MFSMMSLESNAMNGYSNSMPRRTLSHIVVVLMAAIHLLSAMSLSQTAGKCTIKGKVTDAKNHESLPSVNVTVKGTYYGAVTDFDGNFTITNVNPGSYTVEVSLLGYKTVQYT